MSYVRFGVMIVTSTILMMGLMYLNTYSGEHIFFSQTRAWMAVVMGATMSVIMLLLMWSMYKDKRRNVVIVAVSVMAFAVSLWLVRSQASVGDVSYMKAMIPHHSIAILTSSRARIRDPRVRALANGILRTQVKEIADMKALIADLEKHPIPSDAPSLKSAVPPG